MTSLYKNPTAKQTVMDLYDEKLNSLSIPYESIEVVTSFGNTHIIKTGNPHGEKIVLFHGINAGAPLALEAVKMLREKYLLYAIDTIGQATRSAENPIQIQDDSYARWAAETIEKLEISSAHFIGISYGSFILQKVITHRPQLVKKCIFVVPSGLVNGSFFSSVTQLTFPLMKFMMTKKDEHLRNFLNAFVPKNDTFMFRLQKALLTGVHIDYRRPALLTKEEVKNFNSPVYIMVADSDLFFPGDAAVKKAQKIFNNLRGIHYLKNSLHIPAHSDYTEIQNVILKWLEQKEG